MESDIYEGRRHYLCCKGHFFGTPQRVFDLPKQSNSAMKVLMSIIRIGIGLARLRSLYEFYKLVLYKSRTDPSILQQV